MCSDSAAAIQSIKVGQKTREDLLTAVYVKLLNLQLLVHVGIEGDEVADELVKVY